MVPPEQNLAATFACNDILEFKVEHVMRYLKCVLAGVGAVAPLGIVFLVYWFRQALTDVHLTDIYTFEPPSLFGFLAPRTVIDVKVRVFPDALLLLLFHLVFAAGFYYMSRRISRTAKG
jgi:hypothetical protein